MLAQDAILHERYRIITFTGLTRTARSYSAIDGRFGTPVIVRECERSKPKPFREAFVREARILNACQHVAMPVVTDAFAAGDAFYLVERRMPAEPLAAALERDRKPFPPDLVLSWLDDVADVLEYLHGLPTPIVNANVSPASIELSPRGSVFLTDFSLAIEGHGKTLAWTYPYAPLEQMEGLEVDGRADLYALAATAFELLTGQRPLSPHEREQTSGISEFSPLEHFSRVVSRPIAVVLDCAMALQAEYRQPTASEFRSELLAASTATVQAGTGLVLPPGVALPVMRTPPPVPRLDETAETTPPMSPTTIFCRTCRMENDPSRTFCPHCGSLLRSEQRPATTDISRRSDDETLPPDMAPTGPVYLESAPPTVIEMAPDPATISHAPVYDVTAPVSAFAGPRPPRRKSDPLRTTDGAAYTGDPTMPLARILVLEGEEPGRMLLLKTAITTIGRSAGDFIFRQDAFMSGRHAMIRYADNRYWLDDAGSRNGTFLRIRDEARLREGDVVLAGQQLLRFEVDPLTLQPRLRLQLNNGDVAATYELSREVTTIGRTRGDIRFDDDAAMADLHARIERRLTDCYVVDCGSRNGTFLRLTSDKPLADGDVFIVGRHILKFEADARDDHETEDL